MRRTLLACALLLVSVGSPPPTSWVIYISQEGRFALHHPRSWSVRVDSKHTSWLLTPPRQKAGIAILLRPTAPPIDLPNLVCKKLLVSQLPAVRCRDTTTRTVVTTLPDTSQGTFVFSVAIGSPAYKDYDKIVATFQLLRGMH